MSLTKDQRAALAETDFAVPGKRKLPIHDATHVRLARETVLRTKDLTAEERTEATCRILARAEELGVDTSSWQSDSIVSFECMAIEMPKWDGHPNRMPFSGVLTRVDEPSDIAPHGSKGHWVYMSKEVSERALPSLLGMGVDYEPGFQGHDPQKKIGIITAAVIEGSAIKVEGFFYAKDFPEECEQIHAEKDALGFSIEVDARIQDRTADLWVIENCVFTGAAVLYKDLAAYTSTSLAASADKEIDMTPEELKAFLAAQLGPIAESVKALSTEVASIKAAASLAGPIIDQVKPHVDAVNACADVMAAAGVGNDPSNGHVVHLRHMAAHMAAEAVSGRVPKVYRDHDFLEDARVRASADKSGNEETNDALAKVTASLESLSTQVTDLKAKAFTDAPAPARKTLDAGVQTILAKAGLADAVNDGKKLTMTQVDAALEAAGVKGAQQRIAAKLKLRDAGMMEAGQAN